MSDESPVRGTRHFGYRLLSGKESRSVRIPQNDYETLRGLFNQVTSEGTFEIACREFYSRRNGLSKAQQNTLLRLAIDRGNKVCGKEIVAKILGRGIEYKRSGDFKPSFLRRKRP